MCTVGKRTWNSVCSLKGQGLELCQYFECSPFCLVVGMQIHLFFVYVSYISDLLFKPEHVVFDVF